MPESVDLWRLNRTPSITLMDSEGELIGGRGGVVTKPLGINEIPESLKLAFLYTEDRRFYEHGAVDWWGVARAMVVNIGEGGVVQGGSAITQQLAKNIFLTNERTVARKVKELILARQLEAALTKDEIFELYLNRIYLGGGTFGVEAASQIYFDKSARDVTLAEAAMLAGLAKAPSRYAPSSNLELAQQRSQVVLELLRDAEVIEDKDYAEAAAAPAILVKNSVNGEINYFLDYVTEQIGFFITSPDVDLIVSTTLDQTMQEAAETAIRLVLDRDGEESNAQQAALVAMATNGAIKAMVGGRSYRDSQFNRAVQANRQPGSSFKPFVYLTALERGLKPDTIYYDQPIRIGDWSPSNYAGGYRGRVTLTQALQHSINTVAVQVSEDVGRESIVETTYRLGITSNLEANRSLPLGTSEVNLLELTGAYVPFATQGVSAATYAITQIATTDGEVLFERKPPERQRLFGKDKASAMNHMLYQVIYAGTGRRAALEGRPAAGKTGTSQDWRDAWFMGYTPDLVAGVWVGNDDNSPMNRVTGGGLPAMIWHDFMMPAHGERLVAQLPGAFPARDIVADNRMLEFLADLSRQFARVEDRPKKRRFRLFGR